MIHTYSIPSFSTMGTEYELTRTARKGGVFWHCTCPSWKRNSDTSKPGCKHIRAVTDDVRRGIIPACTGQDGASVIALMQAIADRQLAIAAWRATRSKPRITPLAGGPGRKPVGRHA